MFVDRGQPGQPDRAHLARGAARCLARRGGRARAGRRGAEGSDVAGRHRGTGARSLGASVEADRPNRLGLHVHRHDRVRRCRRGNRASTSPSPATRSRRCGATSSCPRTGRAGHAPPARVRRSCESRRGRCSAGCWSRRRCSASSRGAAEATRRWLFLLGTGMMFVAALVNACERLAGGHGLALDRAAAAAAGGRCRRRGPRRARPGLGARRPGARRGAAPAAAVVRACRTATRCALAWPAGALAAGVSAAAAWLRMPPWARLPDIAPLEHGVAIRGGRDRPDHRLLDAPGGGPRVVHWQWTW